ncbi:MAG TPA: hypothetical protein VNZ52_16300 [Candidatus Thermoplasmatota archaeon]|nr:hypothetical protein [Candidatus Thermoplasmatota archaeon]
MAPVRLPFQERWRPLVLSGVKTTTVRTKAYGQAGDTFEVEGRRFELVEVRALPLREARDTWWREEGMTGPEEFERVWTENHPTRGFNPTHSVWLHRFRAL